MTNSSALNHDKSLQIYFLRTERQAKHDFLKDIENTVEIYFLNESCTSQLATM